MIKIVKFCKRSGEKFFLKEDNSPRYYYHITTKGKWGDLITLNPQEDGINRDPDEPIIPRICVAPSIPLCCCAVYVSLQMFAYRTKDPVIGFYPVKVNDFRITGERWLLYPTEFIKVWNMPRNVLSGIYSLSDNLVLGGFDQVEKRRQYKFKKDLLNYMKDIEIPEEARL